MKLELKHLAHYLPYGLKCELLNYKSDYVGVQYSVLNGYYMVGNSPHFTYNGGSTGKSFSEFKPILRPLSEFDKILNELDLTTDFESSYFGNNNEVIFTNTSDKTYLSDILMVNTFMFENHFDVFGLIEQGLAIDINTLSHV